MKLRLLVYLGLFLLLISSVFAISLGPDCTNFIQDEEFGIGGFLSLIGSINSINADSQGNIYVVDSSNSIKKFTNTGELILTINTFIDLNGNTVGFTDLVSADVDNEGNIYVVDRFKDAVYKINPSGKLLYKLDPSTCGYNCPVNPSTGFNNPEDISVDDSEIYNVKVYVADQFNGRVVVFNGADGSALGEIGTSAPGELFVPTDVYVSATDVYVSDFTKLQHYNYLSYMGAPTYTYRSTIDNGNLVGTNLESSSGNFISSAVDSNGDVYAAQKIIGGNTYFVFKFDSGGNYLGSFNGDVIPFSGAHEVYVDSQDRVYVGSGDGGIQRFYCAAPPSCVDVSNSIVSWWSGENNVEDSVGDNNGFLRGNVQFTDGKYGRAFSFDSVGQVEVASSDSLKLPDSGFTVEAWIKYTGEFAEEIIWKARGGVGYSYAISLLRHDRERRARTMGFKVCGEDINNEEICESLDSGVDTADGVWHHVVGTYSSDSQEIEIYLDGELKNSATALVEFILYGDSTLYIGDDFIGELDEVSIYNKVLTPDEVSRIYNGGKCEITRSECVVNEDCSLGQVCQGNICVAEIVQPECITNDDCLDGRVCENSVCVAEIVQPGEPGVGGGGGGGGYSIFRQNSCATSGGVVCGDRDSCSDGDFQGSNYDQPCCAKRTGSLDNPTCSEKGFAAGEIFLASRGPCIDDNQDGVGISMVKICPDGSDCSTAVTDDQAILYGYPKAEYEEECNTLPANINEVPYYGILSLILSLGLIGIYYRKRFK